MRTKDCHWFWIIYMYIISIKLQKLGSQLSSSTTCNQAGTQTWRTYMLTLHYIWPISVLLSYSQCKTIKVIKLGNSLFLFVHLLRLICEITIVFTERENILLQASIPDYLVLFLSHHSCWLTSAQESLCLFYIYIGSVID